MDFDAILLGMGNAVQVGNVIAIFSGVFLGILVGAIPGLSAPMAIAIAVPLTFHMGALPAIAFLIGVNKGGEYGGSISAILLNTPGTPEAASTALDGYPLARQGKAKKALKMALYASVTGDTFSDIVLICVAAPLAAVALMMGPPELMGVLLFAMTFIAALVGKSVVKGLFSASLGILIAMIGLDPVTGAERLTFGIPELAEGIPLPAVGIGLLALGEVLRQVEMMYRGRSQATERVDISDGPRENQRVSFAEYRGCGRTIFRSAVIGTVIGAIPGLGTSLAGFLGYGAAQRASMTPDEFGKGKLEGVAACEAANSAVVGSNLIPLLTLGIPGNGAAALLIGAFVIHGVTPGPLIFQTDAVLIYGLFASLIIANMANLLVGSFGLRVYVQALRVPAAVILPAVTLLCVTGSYVSGGGTFAVGIMLVCAVLGYLMRKLDFSFIAFLIGFILGPMFERELRNTVSLLGDLAAVWQHPVLIAMLLLSVLAVWRLSRTKQAGGLGAQSG